MQSVITEFTVIFFNSIDHLKVPLRKELYVIL